MLRPPFGEASCEATRAGEHQSFALLSCQHTAVFASDAGAVHLVAMKNHRGTRRPNFAQRQDAALDRFWGKHARSLTVRLDLRALFIVFGGLLGASSACLDDSQSSVSRLPPRVQNEQRSGQLRTILSFAANQSDDLLIRLDYFEVDCVSGARLAQGLSASAMVKTAGHTLTPGIPGLEDLPLDHASKHRYSDHLQTLRPGCFDVIATPVDAGGAVDPRCKAAQRSNVRVDRGQTGEIVLINQCQRPGTGGLDSILVHNHAPQLIQVTFENSKFGQCARDVVACASATDVDGDPLVFEWSQIPTDAPLLAEGTKVLQSLSSMPGSHKECIRYRPTRVGRFDIKVKVFDQARVNGELIRFQDITEEGYESKDELDFFFYSMPNSEGGKAKVPELLGRKKSGILVLGSSVVGGLDSEEALAAQAVLDKIRLATPKDANGKDAPLESVELLNPVDWSNKSLRDFSRYRAIVIGDPDCGSTPPEIPQLWTAAVNGNVLIYGSNPSRHGRLDVIEQAIAFASQDDRRTGAFITTSCYYHSAPAETAVNWLNAFGERGLRDPDKEAAFKVVHAGGCPNQASVVASFDLDAQENLLGYSDALLSKWGCSAHNFFQSWPENFRPVALATDYGAFSRVTGFPGEPFVLARGAHFHSCGNGVKEIGEECDDGNRIDGDGCDRSCSVQECGDGFLQGDEYCDDGNKIDGDGCSSKCTIEVDPCDP